MVSLRSIIRIPESLFRKQKDSPSATPGCIRRLRQVLAAQTVCRPQDSAAGIRFMKAEGIPDAHRLMIRLCGSRAIRYIRKRDGGLFRATLPGGAGEIELRGRDAVGKALFAVMTFRIRQLTEVREIRFLRKRKSAPRDLPRPIRRIPKSRQ